MKRGRFRLRPVIVSIVFATAALAAQQSALAQSDQSSGQQPQTVADVPLTLSILHVNDTHSKLEPTLARLVMDIDPQLTGKSVYVELGGMPDLVTAVDALRAREPNPILLHGGDLFQGTLYFTKYEGKADVDFWNLIGLDAATLGNHEFDKGPQLLQSNLLAAASFPIVSAGLDVSKEPLVTDKSRISPYIVKDVGGSRVGIIGLASPETPFISSPGKNVIFNDPAASVESAVRELEANGINKIILLSHQGYSEDLKLAPLLEGVDVIVGGHSHTLLGNFSTIGLRSAGTYPTITTDRDNNKVLVVQANEWGKVLGDLLVDFDAQGNITSYKGMPRAVVGSQFFRVYDLPNEKNELKRVQFTADGGNSLAIREYDGKTYSIEVADDPSTDNDQYDRYRKVYDEMVAKLAANQSVLLVQPNQQALAKLNTYAQGVNQLKGQIVATTDDDLVRGLNQGSGPIIADGMAWKTGADIALNNPGGVRINVNQGPISVAAVYELLPFANTLVTMAMKGSDVVKTLEDGVDFQIERYGSDPNNPYIYVSGVKFAIDASKANGKRISDVVVLGKDGKFVPIELNATYKVVVNNYMAAGGDRYDTLPTISGQYDTGFNDAEVFMEYIQGKTLKNITEERIKLLK